MSAGLLSEWVLFTALVNLLHSTDSWNNIFLNVSILLASDPHDMQFLLVETEKNCCANMVQYQL